MSKESLTHQDTITTSPDEVVSLTTQVKHRGEIRRIIRVFFGRKIAVFGLFITVILVITAIFAPWLAPHNPYKMNMGEELLPPNSKFLLGTDSLGRDTLSRIIYGSRTSLIIGLGATLIAALVGQTLGMIAGMYSGKVFTIIMRLNDTVMTIPMLLLALVIASVLGGGIKNVIIALGIGMIPGHCRLMCGQVLSLRENDYILAGRAIGVGSIRMMVRHILPNAFPPLVVLTTIGLGTTILAEAGLSFLGIGIEPPICAWGSMINDGYRYLMTNPVLAFAPGLAIMLVVFGVNMVGDGLRDALDPRLRGII